MLIGILVIFLIAATLGIFLLTYIIKAKNTPKGLAFIHGGIAASGLILLCLYAIFYRPAPIIAIAIFILAALGGLFLIYRDITGKSIPIFVVLGHGIIALLGLVMLINFLFHLV